MTWPSNLRAQQIEVVRKSDVPQWASIALQGLSYWMGHRQSLYADYPLTEGALVGELCNLIFASLPKTSTLTCEVMYAKLLNRRTTAESVLTERARADLVVSDNNSDPRYIIEVKRASSGKAQIDKDLQRLAETKRHLSEVRAFFFLISEGVRPDRFVGDSGGSILGPQLLGTTRAHYRVRQTLKAAPKYSDRNVGNFCCLIEVFARPSMFPSEFKARFGRNP